MSAEIERLAQRADERERLGGFESLCERFEVAGTDSDNREGLTITGSGLTPSASMSPCCHPER